MAPAMFCIIPADRQLQLVSVDVMVLKQLRQVTLQIASNNTEEIAGFVKCAAVLGLRMLSQCTCTPCLTLKNTYFTMQQAQKCSATKAIWGMQWIVSMPPSHAGMLSDIQ